MNFRIGQSTDIHRFKEGDFIVVGGVKIKAPYGVEAHSDGDALIHAISEALLGSVGEKDLGTFFPDTAKETENIDSIQILKEVKRMIDHKGYLISNIDSLVIIEKVKMAKHIDQMVENIAAVLELDKEQVSVKATRGEKLGFVGEEKGYVAQANVLVYKK